MKRKLTILILLALVTLIALAAARAIWKKRNFKAAQSIEEAQREHGVPILALKPAVTSVVSTLSFDATVEPIERATIMAQIVESISRIYVDEGDSVRGGSNATLLIELDERELKSRRNAAAAAFEDAQNQVRRADRLLDGGGISLQDADRMRVARDAAKSALANADGDLANTKIHSPITGHVSRRLVNPGTVTSVGMLLLEVVDASRLKVEMHIPEQLVERISTGQTCRIRLDAYPNRPPVDATIDILNPALDPATRQLRAVSHLEGTDIRLIPGMHARVDVEIERRANALVLPADALVKVRGQEGVFVVKSEANNPVAVFTPVQPGIRNTLQVEIRNGISADAQVIVQGQKQISDGAKVMLKTADSEQ